jgi:predicted extracellular nuclease
MPNSTRSPRRRRLSLFVVSTIAAFQNNHPGKSHYTKEHTGIISRSRLIIAAILLIIGSAVPALSQSAVPMATNNPYVENFADIANWTNNFASGVGANRFGSVPVNASGTIPDGVKTTVSSATFSTSTSGGVQRGSSQVAPTQSIVLLSTGASPENSTAVAFDVFLNFSGVNAGTLSFNWASVNNSTGDRKGSLRIYTSTNGTTFTELSAAAVLNFTNNSPTSGSVLSVPLPASFNNSPTARIRFYYSNGTGGTTGSRPKISIDDLTVTAVPTGGLPSLSINDVTQNELNSGTSTFTFTVSLSSPAGPSGVTFDIATADGTTNPANAGSDYIAKGEAGRTISSGNSSATFTVTVNGDTVVEANETFFVNVTNIVGATAGDTQGLGTITNDDITITAIYTIQGSGMTSTYTGNAVTTTGVVTGKRSFGATNNGFYIQDPLGDGDLNTSDAILVFTGSALPTVNVGDFVQVSGTVSEFKPATTDEPDGVAPPDPKTATELVGPLTIVNLGPGSMPAPLDVTSNNILDPAALSRSAELEKYEYMRLSVSSLTVSEPTNSFGEFWGVESSRPRPFRAPGIEAGDPVPSADEPPYAPGAPPFPPRFDGNFERVMIDSGAALTTGSTRRAQIQVTTGTVVTNIVGALDYAFDNFHLVLEASSSPGVTGGMSAAVPVPMRASGEFTIGHANLENFSSSNVTRLNKASLYIRNVLRTPDVLGIIEVDTTTSAQQLAAKINADAADPGVNYVAYFGETSGTQDIGYLVNAARVQVVGTPQQYHAATQFTYCGAAPAVLHDRPSFILTANMPRSGGGMVPVTVILNHTKSLIATDSPRPFGTCGTGTEGARNREKRRLQAEDIADLIQSHIGENLVVLGDLNAFDFNDGLGDVVGTLRGSPVPPEQVVEPSTDRWSYDLTNLVYDVSPDQQYSLLFEGNAQALDHILLDSQMLARKTGFAYSRNNADFSDSYAGIAARPERVADHDGPVSYYSFPGDPDNDGVEDPNDNCPNMANPDQADNDNDGIGDICDPDDDNDGIADGVDNCPLVSNPAQADTDGDGIGDTCDPDDDNDGIADNVDNCPFIANTGQADNDHDGIGDACDPDDDNDGIADNIDNCPLIANPDQADNDHDGIGDTCDPDDDNDGIADGADNCPFVANPGQADNDNDGIGDTCDPDDDNDGVADNVDNCPLIANPGQADNDHDGIGDTCDPDDDNDRVADNVDNCQFIANTGQADNDHDGIGDACDPDDDNDGIADNIDNCPLIANSDQADNDHDGIGDTCDPDDDNDGVADTADNCPLIANPGQADNDHDGIGDTCDADDDNDGVADDVDNCPLTANPSQADNDHDGVGDTCDPDDDNDGVLDLVDNCPTTANPDQADFDHDGMGDVCDPATGPPSNKDQCKDGGWMRFDVPRRFKNQGDCVQYVNTGK